MDKEVTNPPVIDICQPHANLSGKTRLMGFTMLSDISHCPSDIQPDFSLLGEGLGAALPFLHQLGGRDLEETQFDDSTV